MLPTIIMVPNCSALWNCFFRTVINIWDISTRQLADVLIWRGFCQTGRWRNKETTEIGKCGRNTILRNLKWIRNTSKWRHKELLDNKKVDGSWASEFDGIKTWVQWEQLTERNWEEKVKRSGCQELGCRKLENRMMTTFWRGHEHKWQGG